MGAPIEEACRKRLLPERQIPAFRHISRSDSRPVGNSELFRVVCKASQFQAQFTLREEANNDRFFATARRAERGRTIAGEFFRDGEARRGFGSSFGNILKFAFELRNMVSHIFWPKAKRSKATHGKRPQEQEPRKLSGVEDLNIQVIRSYSWAAAESPKKLAV